MKTRGILFVGLLAGSYLFTISQAHAAAKSWTNGSTDFLWNTTSANWSPSVWLSSDAATFDATGVGTVTVDAGGITAAATSTTTYALTVNAAGYTIGGGTITFITNGGAVSANEDATLNSAINNGTGGAYLIFVAAVGKTLTLNGNITSTPVVPAYFRGGGSVNVNGSIGSNIGNVILDSGSTAVVTFGAANTFTGQLAIQAPGTVSFSNVNQLGTGGGTGVGKAIVIQSGGTLRYTGTVAGSAAARDLYWNGGSATIDITTATGDLKFNITGGGLGGGTGTFTKTGAGILTLATSGSDPNLSKPVVLNAGTLALQANGTNLVNITSTMTGAAGTQINVLANTGAGTGTVRNGSLSADWSANLASLDVASGGTFDIDGNLVRVDALTGGGNITNSYYRADSGIVGHTLTVGANSGSGTFSGVISGTGTTPNMPGEIALTKLGPGTQTLTGASTYSGATTISGGTLRLSGTGASVLGSVSLSAGGGGELNLSGTGGNALADTASLFAPSVAVLTLDAGVTETINNIQANGGSLTVNLGSGSVLASALYPGTISTTGAITLNGGSVTGGGIRIGHLAGSVGSLILQGGVVLTTTAGNTTGDSGSGTVGSLLDIQNGTIVATSGSQIIQARTIKLNGSLTTSATGQVVVQGGGAFGASSIAAGSTLTTSVVFVGVFSNVAVLDQNGGDVTVTRVILDHNGGASAGTYNLNGGTLTINSGTAGQGIDERIGSSTFNFNGGTLKFGADNSNVLVVDTANVKAGGAKIDSNGQNVTIAQALLNGGGGGGLTKIGAGTLSLTGTNTYSGATSVTAGTLALTTGTAIDDAATLSIAAGARVAVLNGVNETVYELYLDGAPASRGTWGDAGSGADYIDPVHFSGDGMVTVLNGLPRASVLIVR